MASTLFPDGLSSTLRVVGGVHTTASATDAVATGLSTIVAAAVGLKSDPADATAHASATWTGGTLTIKTWKFTNAATDCTPTAATTWAKDVAWIAMGY